MAKANIALAWDRVDIMQDTVFKANNLQVNLATEKKSIESQHLLCMPYEHIDHLLQV